MTTCKNLPCDFTITENIWIPMADGTRLAARFWLPNHAKHQPVPAILEYIPYRKRDIMRQRDSQMHGYFAGHGYACIRVDLRGSGDSEGVLKDEYTEQELQDGLEVLNWISKQPWCNGRTGVIGISWGGFNGLQMAALHPPSLKAIISVASTDDRYADDIHHMGGCLLGDNLSWASNMLAYNTCPPDPAIVGDPWEEMWQQRLNESGFWLDQWMRHQTRDSYWQHGSICEAYEKVQTPVMLVSGWTDGYTNAVFRMLENLSCPRLGIVGPWGHKYPHIGRPGPAIGFLQECLAWWDHWLCDINNEVMKKPMLRAWVQSSALPTTQYEHRPGQWISEPLWPSREIRNESYWLHDSGLTREKPSTSIKLSEQSPLSTGLFAGKWCSYTSAPDLPHDQRQEDGGALVFESEELPSDLQVLGAPFLNLNISVNRPLAMIAARISEVFPDGKATRVTYGLLNLAHRNGSEAPTNLVPGTPYGVSVQLNHMGHCFSAGNKIRLSLSTSYWPLAWPPPEPTKMTIDTSNSLLTIPVRAKTAAPDDETTFLAPEWAPAPPREMIEPGEHNWKVTRDLASDHSTLEVIADDGLFHLEDIDLLLGRKGYEWYSFTGDNFNSVKGQTERTRYFARPQWEVSTHSKTLLTSDKQYFYLYAEIDAYKNKKRIFSQTWDTKIKRNFC